MTIKRCTGSGCPLKGSCALYLADDDKGQSWHWIPPRWKYSGIPWRLWCVNYKDAKTRVTK